MTRRKKKQQTVVRQTTVVQKRAPSRGRKSAVPRNVPNVGKGMTPAQSYAHSLDNPFSHSSCIPDGSKGTGCFSIRETGALVTGATGTAWGLAVAPGAPDAVRSVDTNSNATSFTFSPGGNWQAAAQTATIQSLYKAMRVVSAGIRVTYSGATINDSGMLCACQFARGTSLSDLNGGTISTVNANSQWFEVQPLRNGIEVHWRPEDMVDACDFTPTNGGTISLSAGRAKPFIFVGCIGAATAGAGIAQYEWVVNYEGQYRDNTFSPGGISTTETMVPPEPGWYEKAQGMLAGISPFSNALYNAGQPIVSAMQPAMVQGVGYLANGYMSRLVQRSRPNQPGGGSRYLEYV